MTKQVPIKWVDSMPVPADRESLTKSQVRALVPTALSMPYEPTIDPETKEPHPDELRFRYPDGSWMTMAEVGKYRQALAYARGDKEAGSFLMDRWLGKPIQQVESMTVNATFSEWLTQIAKEDEARKQQTITVTATPLPARDEYDVI